MQELINWRHLFDTAGGAHVDVSEIKGKLPITFVLEAFGHPVTEYDGTSAHCTCPFHVDSAPSFDVYGEDLERWGCFPCSLGGDVIDLVQKLWNLDNFGAAMTKAAELLASMPSDWQGPTKGVKKAFDWDAARALVEHAQNEAPLLGPATVAGFLEAKGLNLPPLWLASEFRLGVSGPEIVIPYYDRAGALVSYKHRTAQTKALSPAGSGQFDEVLYGEWRDQGNLPVILCEGESDVWAAAAFLPEFAALGLPTGAGAHPKQANRLAGRSVVIAFDGDAAGLNARVKWHAALKAEGCDVQIAPTPDGYDLASMSPEDLRSMVLRSRAVPALPPGIDMDGAGYFRPGKDQPTYISNWTFSPTRELRGDGAMAYEGVVLPSGRKAVLSSTDLKSKSTMVRWSSLQGGSWYGSDVQAQQLQGVLQAQGPFLSAGRMATVAGLHEGQFVWPGGRIGSDYWVYVPPSADVHLEGRMSIEQGEWDVSQVGILRELHEHRVTDPILAWMALAPLRILLREFPVLAVTGSSGSGKTTLVEQMVRNFTGTLITNNLTATTRHGVFAHFGATNAFPVWFDEYRPGARKDALEAIDQLLRDAYTMQASSKGGMGEHWAEVVSMPTTSPIIVSGEDAFSEVSHTSRMVLCALPMSGRRSDTLARVRGWGDHGLPKAYLEWLYMGMQEGTLPEIRNWEAEGLEGMHERHRTNIGALQLGWALLSQFVWEHNPGVALDEPDFSLVTEQAQESALHDPIGDAIQWCIQEFYAQDFAREVRGDVGIRVENFVLFVTKSGGHVLPGGPKAVVSYLRDHYGATERDDFPFEMGPKRAWVFPHTALSTSLQA